MKLVQLNVWQGRLHKQILDFLKAEQPDVLCLQEVYSSAITSPLFDLLHIYESVQQLFPEHRGYFSPTYDMAMLGETVHFGIALFSRFPISQQKTFFITGEHHSYGGLQDYAANVRNLQRVTVHPTDDTTFTLFNHHGYWEPDRMGSATSVVNMQRVADIIAQSSQPIIFSGDLNVVAESPAMQPIQALLRDLTQEYKVTATLSSLGKVTDVACDHICVSKGITVRQFAVREALVSDHKALVLEFDVAAA
jgi:endonuclease/exonuclease/phosphatase family metal-dependent hydrolase